ncbi:MAG: DEAD/DEAH box helicase [Firmicutes bacterium]|nr:DEAD/DEAH box helicase [Bacillota bacterium]
MTFKELNLDREITSAVSKAGYEEPTPIQEKAIPEILKGHDLIACAQTGTGKTAAFALPILSMLKDKKPRRIRALIITPTRELAIQIFDNFKKYGRYLKLRAVCIYGGAKQGPQIDALLSGGDILIATPGRLLDFMGSGYINLSQVETFVLDEADRMLDMGFIGDVRKIVKFMPQQRQTLMFSATMPKEIELLAQELLTDPVTIKVAPPASPAETVDQKLCFVDRADKNALLIRFLQSGEVRRTIVFTRTKYGADKLVRALSKAQIPAAAIHGDKTQGQRQNALERFKAGQYNVLVATDVASRGIDVPKLSHVFNYELPDEPESYIHRIGRAGRAGESGISISFCSGEELEKLRDIEKMLKKEIPLLETEYSAPLVRMPAAKAASGKSSGRAGQVRRDSRTSRSVRTGRSSRAGYTGRDGRADAGSHAGRARHTKSRMYSSATSGGGFT